MRIKVITEKTGIEKSEILALRGEAGRALDRLWSGREPMTGWVQAPMSSRGELLERVLAISDIIRNEAELLVVLGIGGSYLGAKAAIEALPKFERGIPVRFLGFNLCSDYYLETLEEIKNKKTMVCVVSKSGNTVEVRTALEIIKPVLEEKYGSAEAAARRILAITDAKDGSLREEAEEMGYTTLEIPRDIGGRYSVLTAAGLLPMAVSGIDIRGVLDGAADCANSPEWDGDAVDYAISRFLLQEKGKEVELIELCHSRLNYLGEWMKQLYGESEGKDGKGLFPASVDFTADLHSMGQYIQEGKRLMFETVVRLGASNTQVYVPRDEADGDGLNFLAGESMDFIRDRAMEGTLLAHTEGGVPNIIVETDGKTPEALGQLIYFFEYACGLSGYLLDVNPFDQPGVEAYKKNMFALLGKPGYESRKAELEAKLNK